MLITEDSDKSMSAADPRAIEEVEPLMKKRGIGVGSIQLFIWRQKKPRLDLFRDEPLSPSNCLHSFHPLLHGGLRKVGSFLKLFQNPGSFILFLKSSESPVDRLILLNNDTNQFRSPRFVVG